jgi:hypothetical protein
MLVNVSGRTPARSASMADVLQSAAGPAEVVGAAVVGAAVMGGVVLVVVLATVSGANVAGVAVVVAADDELDPHAVRVPARIRAKAAAVTVAARRPRWSVVMADSLAGALGRTTDSPCRVLLGTLEGRVR